MSRNGIGVIHYYTSIWNSGTYIIELNKKIGYFIKMFVCTELHKYQNSLKAEEKQKLINFINQLKEIKKTLILSDTEEPTLEEYKTYLRTVYTIFENEEKKGIINSTTPNKLRLISDLCEPLIKFKALDGPFMKLQQYERYKAKMYEEGLKNGIKPNITSLNAFRYNPCDDIKYFSLFKPEIMEINVNQQINNNNQNQMINNIGMAYDTGNNNMNNNMGNNYMNNNMNNMNNNINNNNMGNNYMNNNMNNMNNNMGNNYMNNNMNYDIGNNYMNNNMNNMNNMTYDNNNMNYTINYDVNKMNNDNNNYMNNMNNDNNNYMNITNYDNNNMNYNNNNMNIGTNYDDGNNNNNMNFTNPYLQEQTNMYNPYLNQTTNENNYTLNNPSEIQVKTYSNEPKSILNKKDEFFDMSDTVLEEKKQNILNKNINAINELKKKNISLAMQYIANSIGILKNFPKDKKTDFI